MQKHDINSPALRDPKREWYDAEEVEEAMEEYSDEIASLRAEIRSLEKAHEWRNDWENVVGKDLLIKHSRVKPFFVENIHQDEIEVHKSMSCTFKIIEP